MAVRVLFEMKAKPGTGADVVSHFERQANWCGGSG